MYHIFHAREDFLEQVKKYKSEGYHWIQENHSRYNPTIYESDMPIVLNADNENTMMVGIININKAKYFSNPIFVKEYNRSLRKKKLEKINGNYQINK